MITSHHEKGKPAELSRHAQTHPYLVFNLILMESLSTLLALTRTGLDFWLIMLMLILLWAISNLRGWKYFEFGVRPFLFTCELKNNQLIGFNDVTKSTSDVWFQSFIRGQQPQINTGANGLQRLDYVVKSAEAHGIKLIINFVNNWADYGGMPAYNTYYGTTKLTWYTGMSSSRV